MLYRCRDGIPAGFKEVVVFMVSDDALPSLCLKDAYPGVQRGEGFLAGE